MKESLRVGGLLVGVAALTATLVGQAPARPEVQPRPTVRVGVVDRAALERAAAAVGADSAEAFRSRRMAELAAIQDSIRALQKRIVDGGESLSPDAREEILAEIRRRQDELRKADQATKDELKVRADRSRDLMAEHIAKAAAARALEIVLDRGDAAVLWVSPAVDLTTDVIAAMRQAVSR